MRYSPYGVMLSKQWLFDKGGRPVIYQPEAEFAALPESLQYRHVRFEPPKTDYSWEREWRLCTESLVLEPEATTVIVPTRRWADHMRGEHHVSQVRTASLMSGPLGMRPFQWHFIALEDLGVEMA
jgi:hypothetical protein